MGNIVQNVPVSECIVFLVPVDICLFEEKGPKTQQYEYHGIIQLYVSKLNILIKRNFEELAIFNRIIFKMIFSG